MELIIALIIGGLVGWLASIVMGTNAEMGVLGNVVVGVVGSLLGHFLARAMGLSVEGGIAGWLMAILGAMVLIAVLRALGGFRGSARIG
jgi:uncharacterized membrane protein YeaQ/YmgE (transglycosylase-associated protein family)